MEHNDEVHLRDVLICEFAQFIVEVCLLLLKLVQGLLSFLELVPHFDLDRARLIDLGRLLIELLLHDLKFVFACFKCLDALLALSIDTIDGFLHIEPLQPAA
jgi:hypothetical protein